MGLICIALKIPKCIDIGFLLGLLEYYLKFTVMAALARLGLLNSPEQADTDQDHSTDSTTTTSVLVMDSLSPSQIPLHSLVAMIKKSLSVIEYSNLLERNGAAHHEDVDMVCSVCLDCVERSHEVRELSNCSHVFHRACLDRWVDEGRVTCPLCRSLLFPAMGQSTSRGRNAYFVG